MAIPKIPNPPYAEAIIPCTLGSQCIVYIEFEVCQRLDVSGFYVGMLYRIYEWDINQPFKVAIVLTPKNYDLYLTMAERWLDNGGLTMPRKIFVYDATLGKVVEKTPTPPTQGRHYDTTIMDDLVSKANIRWSYKDFDMNINRGSSLSDLDKKEIKRLQELQKKELELEVRARRPPLENDEDIVIKKRFELWTRTLNPARDEEIAAWKQQAVVNTFSSIGYANFYYRTTKTGGTVNKAEVIRNEIIDSYSLRMPVIKYPSNWNLIAEVVNVIKTIVPASARSYDPATKYWEVEGKYWPHIESVLKHLQFTIEMKQPATIPENFFYEQTTSSSSSKLTREVILSKLGTLLGITITNQAPDELKKLYRKAALALHPDRNNGDGSKMSELNMLWSEFNK